MHAHYQIEYGTCESLNGFNPFDPDDVKLIHDTVDEFLKYLKSRWPEGNRIGNESVRFIIFDDVDGHKEGEQFSLSRACKNKVQKVKGENNADCY